MEIGSDRFKAHDSLLIADVLKLMLGSVVDIARPQAEL